MLAKVGFLLVCIGAMMGDSECLLIPAAIIGIGFALIRIGCGREASHEESTLTE